jgi:hypothetical protein
VPIKLGTLPDVVPLSRGARRSAAVIGLRAGKLLFGNSIQNASSCCAARVIGFRASDAVVMAGLRNTVSRRGGRASAAAPMAG